MKAQVKTNQFKVALNQVATVKADSETLPLLSAVHLVILNGILTLSMSNLQEQVSVNIPCAKAKDGECIVPYSQLRPIVDSLSGLDHIDVEVKSKKLVLSFEDYVNVSIDTINEEFPEQVELTDKAGIFTIAVEKLMQLRKCLPFVSTDELRRCMFGVNFELGDEINFVATDGHRLMKLNIDGWKRNKDAEELDKDKKEATAEPKKSANSSEANKPEATQVLVPKAFCNAIVSIFKTLKEGVLTMAIEGDTIAVFNSDVKVSGRLIDDRFPQYQSVIPTEHKGEIFIGAQHLCETVRRILTVSPTATNKVTLTSQADTLTLESNNEFGSGRAQVKIKSDIDIKIGFNGEYLVQLLNQYHGEICIQFETPLKAAVVKLKDKNYQIGLVMPIRIEEEQVVKSEANKDAKIEDAKIKTPEVKTKKTTAKSKVA